MWIKTFDDVFQRECVHKDVSTFPLTTGNSFQSIEEAMEILASFYVHYYKRKQNCMRLSHSDKSYKKITCKKQNCSFAVAFAKKDDKWFITKLCNLTHTCKSTDCNKKRKKTAAKPSKICASKSGHLEVKKRKTRGSEDDDKSQKKTKLSEDDDKIILALSYYGRPNTKATSIKFRVSKSQKFNVVFNEFERRIDAMGCQCNSITRVKYKDLIDGKSREDIAKALQNQGFFILSGSDKKLEEEILELSTSSKIYFGLPEGMRETNRNGASKEVVSFSKGSDLESPYLHNVKNKSSNLLANFEMIAKEVLTELAKGMHLHEETFTQMLSSENNESEVRTINYKKQLDETIEPGVPNVPLLALSSHVDKGLITFIKDASAEEHSVIQAKCPNDGYYVNIPLGKDILILSGNSLSVASNGRVHAMNHRVKWLDEAAEHSTRTSIVCSIRANPETRLGPIRWCNLDPDLCSRDNSNSKDILYSTLVTNLRHLRYKESNLLTIGTLDQAFLRESPSVFSQSHHFGYRYLSDGEELYGDQTIKSFAGDDDYEELLVNVVEEQG